MHVLLKQPAGIGGRARLPIQEAALIVNARGRRITTQGIPRIVSRLASDAGSDSHASPHMLRHTVATLLLRMGADSPSGSGSARAYFDNDDTTIHPCHKGASTIKLGPSSSKSPSCYRCLGNSRQRSAFQDIRIPTLRDHCGDVDGALTFSAAGTLSVRHFS